MKKSLIALAFGTLALGMTEFVMMGILADVVNILHIQRAFNMGNALGAFLGGLPIAAGLSDRYAALVGAPMALAVAVLMVVFYRKYER